MVGMETKIRSIRSISEIGVQWTNNKSATKVWYGKNISKTRI